MKIDVKVLLISSTSTVLTHSPSSPLHFCKRNCDKIYSNFSLSPDSPWRPQKGLGLHPQLSRNLQKLRSLQLATVCRTFPVIEWKYEGQKVWIRCSMGVWTFFPDFLSRVVYSGVNWGYRGFEFCLSNVTRVEWIEWNLLKPSPRFCNKQHDYHRSRKFARLFDWKIDPNYFLTHFKLHREVKKLSDSANFASVLSQSVHTNDCKTFPPSRVSRLVRGFWSSLQSDLWWEKSDNIAYLVTILS